MTPTAIQWTDETWNPTTGCDRVSPGCDNCYALTLAKRLKGMGARKYQNDGNPETSGPGFGLTMHEDSLRAPLSWKRPRRVFVNSMSDLFHSGVSDAFLLRVFSVMAETPQHTYQILTKRHARMRTAMGWIGRKFEEDPRVTWPLPNVWVGVSAEDQKWADIRIPHLLATPAAVRFVSAEPLLGPVDLRDYFDHKGHETDQVNAHPAIRSCMTCAASPFPGVEDDDDIPAYHRDGLNWVIVGGESGPNSRVMYPAWARSLRDQCTNAGVAYFFKQWGEYAPGTTRKVGKKAAGRELDGRTWDQMPEAQPCS